MLQAVAHGRVVRAFAGQVLRVASASPEDNKAKVYWENSDFSDPAALALCPNALIVAGQLGPEGESTDARYGLAALDIESGKPLWKATLPAAPIDSGMAVDHRGRIAVTLRNGGVACYGP
jgi:hypothetical protein